MGLFDGTRFERPITCERCGKTMKDCHCPRDAAGQIKLPQHQTARVRIDKRAKGKMVTLVEGLDPAASNLEDLTKLLRSKCAAGGTVNQNVIEIQGNHRDRVAAVLKEIGYQIK
jgi:translation initiation factor 1